MNLAPVCSSLQNLKGLAEPYFGFLLKTAQEGPVDASHQQAFGNQPVRGPRMQTHAKIPCSSHYLLLSRTLVLSCSGSASAEFTEEFTIQNDPQRVDDHTVGRWDSRGWRQLQAQSWGGAVAGSAGIRDKDSGGVSTAVRMYRLG